MESRDRLRRRARSSVSEPPLSVGEKVLFVVVVLLALAIVAALAYGTMVNAHG